MPYITNPYDKIGRLTNPQPTSSTPTQSAAVQDDIAMQDAVAQELARRQFAEQEKKRRAEAERRRFAEASAFNAAAGAANTGVASSNAFAGGGVIWNARTGQMENSIRPQQEYKTVMPPTAQRDPTEDYLAKAQIDKEYGQGELSPYETAYQKAKAEADIKNMQGEETQKVNIIDPKTGKLTTIEAPMGKVLSSGVTSYGQLPPSLQKVKDAKVADIYDVDEYGKVKSDMIAQAQEASKNITPGVAGGIYRNSLGFFKPNDAQLGEWQKIKMVLTDAQLLNTALTKGAISDKEMELFSRAAANNDYGSIVQMQPVFDKLIRFLAAERNSKFKSFKKNYGEDPNEWFNAGMNVGDVSQENQPQKEIYMEID